MHYALFPGGGFLGLDGRLLARAKDALEERRRRNDLLYGQRLEEVYERAPGVRALDGQIRATMAEVVAVSLGLSSEDQIEDIRLRNLELQDERAALIRRAGFPADYLDDEHTCGLCRDTGFVRAEICGCLMELYKKEQTESLSNLLKLGDETFDSFDLSYYDDKPVQATGATGGVSPRRSMEIIYEICVEYSRKFGKQAMNLFFNGAPGLGKTFLSACIARVVSENGFSVVYDTVISVFSKFEEAKFHRSDEPDEARLQANELRRYLECDLLILDDLGTEMTTAFTISALYEIINTRLVTNRKTIISSNLTLLDLRSRYSRQIMSRLEGEYQVLTFRGEDIRKKKNAV